MSEKLFLIFVLLAWPIFTYIILLVLNGSPIPPVLKAFVIVSALLSIGMLMKEKKQ